MSGETIVITAVKSGTGKVSVDVLAKQTEVVDEKQNGTIQSIKNKGNAISVSVLFENSGLAKGYTMNQIGIYAKRAIRRKYYLRSARTMLEKRFLVNHRCRITHW